MTTTARDEPEGREPRSERARTALAAEDIRPRHYALGRAAGALVIALFVALAPGVGPNRWTLVVVLLIGAPFMWAIEKMSARRGWLWMQSVVDVVSTVIAAHLAPDHWHAVLLVGVIAVTANLMHMGTAAFLALQTVLAAGMASAATIHDLDGWALPLMTVLVVSLPIGGYAEWLRSRDHLVASRMDDMAQSVAAIVWEADAVDGRVRHLMGPTADVLGHTHAEFAARYPVELVHPDDRRLLDRPLPPDRSRVERTARLRHADGTWRWMREVVGLVGTIDGEERIRAVAMDITDLVVAREELRHRAERDQLTGLLNRASVVDELERRLADGEPVSLLLLDLDGFKAINDTMGHLTGDALLRVQARRLEAIARGGDAVGRLGGDEFVVVSDVTTDDALAVAGRVAADLGAPLDLDGVELTCRVSVGLALAPDHGTSADELLRHADEAMYRAKRAGTGVQLYRAEPDGDEARRVTRLVQLTRGLAREMELWFQPMVDTATLQPVALEGLARWRHPDEGVLLPADFLDLIESSGLTARFDGLMMELAIARAAVLGASGDPLRVAVNVTPRGLSDRAFARRVRNELQACGVPPDRLAVEISERAVDEDRRNLLRTLAELREMGVHIALDDFGTGFSSLTRLRDLPVDEIKIDGTFVAALTRSAADEIIVRSTIEMARELGLGVVAEGVDDERTLERLRELGCARAQGYLFGLVLPGDVDHPSSSTAQHPLGG